MFILIICSTISETAKILNRRLKRIYGIYPLNEYLSAIIKIGRNENVLMLNKSCYNVVCKLQF